MDTKRNLYDHFWHMVVGVSGWGVSVCIRVGWGCTLDRVLPCSDACLRFQGFCFMQDQTNAIGQSERMSLCLSVPENKTFNKRVVPSSRVLISHAGSSIKRHCYEIRVTYGHTLNSQRLNKDFIAKLK